MAARFSKSKTAAARMGGSRFLLGMLLVLVHVAAYAVVDDADVLNRVRALTRGGATQLALQLIDTHQPAPTERDAWMQWERERFALLRAQHYWAMIGARVVNLPDGLPIDFVRWAKTEAARAELQAGRAEGARRFLRELLWGGEASREAEAEWRQLVIRSYLLDDNVQDASIALQRYRSDFRADTPSWRLLEATILIRAGKPKEAYARIGSIKTHEGRLLALLAALRAEAIPSRTVLARAEQLAEETRNKPVLQQQVWALMAEAAAHAVNPERRMYALERALTLARENPSTERLLVVQADDLWATYDRFAETVGNEKRLLVGQDQAWLKQAESYRRDDAMQARAFYAFLVVHATDTKVRTSAEHRLTDSLIEDGRGEVLRALFTGSRRYPTLAKVPEYTRYRLADLALAGYDIAFAGDLMRGLETPPEGEDQDDWILRRARVLVYAGRFEDALQLLGGMLAKHPKFSDDLAERYLQVIFDLQAAHRHADVIDLLGVLQRQVSNTRLQREIYYWIAESRSALGEYREAAELYLRSATFENPTGGDMWGQTARYHAAETLGKAGLTQDARLVFQALLKHTADAKQRAVIERSIQQLWLIEKKTTTP
ncbi:MAG TPA: hypothetical protein DIC36_10460 [Gammaproteobacteria bacterium]|nr:hypothetical protein [Gammaproteobacteria bacterium]